MSGKREKEASGGLRGENGVKEGSATPKAQGGLQVARQLEVATSSGGHSDALEEAVALLQHHDSITGTEKQHVANDYHKRLAKGSLLHSERECSKKTSSCPPLRDINNTR